ncbi:MAG: peptide deformylase [Holophaga sp.]|nr:peptide deformylase [Holophaga sp.]
MSSAILPLGDPRLRLKAQSVPDLQDPAFRAENAELQDVLEAFRKEHGFGRGVAAPQIGVSKRFIALNLGQGPFSLINPEITWRSPETFTLWDDCMCFPWLLVRVRRHRSISVRFLDERGASQHWEHLGQAESELIQHEYDHLDGILATDLAEGPEGIISREAFEAYRDRFSASVDYTIQPTLASPGASPEGSR